MQFIPQGATDGLMSCMQIDPHSDTYCHIQHHMKGLEPVTHNTIYCMIGLMLKVLYLTCSTWLTKKNLPLCYNIHYSSFVYFQTNAARFLTAGQVHLHLRKILHLGNDQPPLSPEVARAPGVWKARSVALSTCEWASWVQSLLCWWPKQITAAFSLFLPLTFLRGLGGQWWATVFSGLHVAGAGSW